MTDWIIQMISKKFINKFIKDTGRLQELANGESTYNSTMIIRGRIQTKVFWGKMCQMNG